MSPEAIVMQYGSVRVTTYVPGWAWRCQECGWLGVDHTTEEGARHEADRHLVEKHAGLALPQNQEDGE